MFSFSQRMMMHLRDMLPPTLVLNLGIPEFPHGEILLPPHNNPAFLIDMPWVALCWPHSWGCGPLILIQNFYVQVFKFLRLTWFQWFSLRCVLWDDSQIDPSSRWSNATGHRTSWQANMSIKRRKHKSVAFKKYLPRQTPRDIET